MNVTVNRAGVGVMLAGLVAVGWIVFGGVRVLGEQRALDRQPASSVPPAQRALVEKYCVTCHNDRLKTGDLVLENRDLANIGADARVWEAVVRKLRAGAMPPLGLPRPDKSSYEGFASYLEAELDRAAAASPNPGRKEAFHRLNRSEYQNAIRDLLGFEISDREIGELIPSDDTSYGFDNIAGILGISPTLLERYTTAAEKIAGLALGKPTIPTAVSFKIPSDFAQEERLDGLPYGTRGGGIFRHHFPQDGSYDVKLILVGPIRLEPHQIEVAVDGERVHVFTLGVGDELSEKTAQEEFTVGDVSYVAAPGGGGGQEAHMQVRVPVKAGPRNLQVAFLRKTFAEPEPVRQPYQRPFVGTLQVPHLKEVIVSGPFDATGRDPVEETPSRRRIFSCRPTGATDEAACARNILSTLARRAYRRPITNSDLQVLLDFYADGRKKGGFETGIDLALRRLLVSPEFLFRLEYDPENIAPNTNYRLSDLEIASRLSFFLWSTIPDDELLDLASRSRLKDPMILAGQVRRMLADKRSSEFTSNFAGQWLLLRHIAGTSPNVDIFPEFDDGLRQGFREETERFFDSVIREDRSVLDLLTADYTFVNERLARHYGIANIYGSDFRRVTIPDPNRRGLLGQGSILTVTSEPTRTKPVARGKWILENILGITPPAPPPNVPALKEEQPIGKTLTMRERMERHRANPQCASCHVVMDPLGFSLENFDAIGRYRAVGESGAPINASGALPDGTRFDGVSGLRQALLTHPEQFVSVVAEKMLTYALGRGTEYYDVPAIRRIVRESARNNYRFSSLVLGIVSSTPFQMRRSEP